VEPIAQNSVPDQVVEQHRCSVAALLATDTRRGAWELRCHVRISLQDIEFLAGAGDAESGPEGRR
jgi:hypothetical protein